MKDAVLTVVAIAVILLGIPLAICFFKDWLVIRKHGDLAPDGSRLDRIHRIEGQLHARHTKIRGIFWILLAIGLAGWLVYKNLVWMPDKRELHDLLGVVFILIMTQHGYALLKQRKTTDKTDEEMPNKRFQAIGGPRPPQPEA